MSIPKRIFGSVGKAKTELFTPPPPPSDDAVARAEAALSIKFPGSFISFLRESRTMQLPLCARFYRIGGESLGADDIVDPNRQEHEESSSPLSPFLIAFYNDGMGNQVCVDQRRCSPDGEYPIVFWDHELGADENLAASELASECSESAGMIASSCPEWLKTIG